MSITNDISNKKYIIHFKRNPITNSFVNLSEDNFIYSIENPIKYQSSILTTEPLNSLSLNEYGLEFLKNSTGFSPFISIKNISSYITNDENFTIYFRLFSNSLNNANIDLYSTIYPGTDENNVGDYFKFGIYNGKLIFVSKLNKTYSFECDLSTYTTLKQYHICLTRMNNAVRAYIDGHKIYDSYDNGEKSRLYNDVLFFSNNKATNIYIGENKKNEKIYLDDIAICKGFAFYGYTDFEVPTDIINPKITIKKNYVNKTIRFKITKSTYKTITFNIDTYRKLNKINKVYNKTNRIIKFIDTKNIKIKTKRIIKYTINKKLNNIIRNIFKTYINYNNMQRIVLKDNNMIFINTIRTINQKYKNLNNIKRILIYSIKTYNSTLIEYIKRNINTILLKRNIILTCKVINNTSRTTINYKIRIVAFVTNPLYIRKKGM